MDGRHDRGRWGAVRFTVAGLATLMLSLGLVAPPVHGAGVATNTNACLVSGNNRYSDVDISVAGSATNVGPDHVDLESTSIELFIPDQVHLELYNQNYYEAGFNGVGVSVAATLAASNSVEAEQQISTTAFAGVTVSDPDGVKNTGDESIDATDFSYTLPPSSWTPTGGVMTFTQTGVALTTSHFFGASLVEYDCVPGTTPDRLTVVSSVPAAFESIAPAVAPSCSDRSVIGGVGESVDVDVVAQCSDLNEDIDPSTVEVVSGPTGGVVDVAPSGVVTYANTDPSIGTDEFSVVVSDALGLVSNQMTISVTVQALRSMDQASDTLTLGQIELDGGVAMSSAALATVTVSNTSTSGAGFTVSAYAVDLGSEETVLTPVDVNGDGLPDVEVADCSALANVSGRTCIPSSNLGWMPRAEVVEDSTESGVAAVDAGPAGATSTAGWLDQVRNGADDVSLADPQVLCTAGLLQAAGRFACDADVYLALPASAGAGIYRGYLVITIL